MRLRRTLEVELSVLTPSTTLAFSSVFSRRLTYFHVVQSSVLPVQENFQSGFDSRQLHHRSSPGRKAWPVLFLVNIFVQQSGSALDLLHGGAATRNRSSTPFIHRR